MIKLKSMTCIDCSHMFVYDHIVDKICNCF
nr:MAG TPA: hypothetical protein [Caudoviricetes sp.]